MGDSSHSYGSIEVKVSKGGALPESREGVGAAHGEGCSGEEW